MGAGKSLLKSSWWSFRASGRIAARHSQFKAIVIATFVGGFEAALFLLFLRGFHFLDSLAGVGLWVIPKLFALFFFGLGVMLVLSSIVTAYAAMYRSGEIPFLIVRPFSMRQISLYRFLQASLLSSWALFFIIVPFVSSYAWHESLGFMYVLWTLLFCVPFVLWCSALGTIITMVIVRWLPRGRFVTVAVGTLIVIVIGGIWYMASTKPHSPDDSALILNRLLPSLAFASQRMMPSWWVADGITSLSSGDVVKGMQLLMLLTSNCLMAILMVQTLGGKVFYGGWQRVVAASSKTGDREPLLKGVSRSLSFLKHDVRAMVVKDMRTLLRDPMQWSQFLIFFGLLGLYFASLRAFRYDRLEEVWRSLIAFLNVFSVSTVVCAMASRFVYPQLSLEGQGFWILGLSPTTMRRIVMTKFVASAISMCAISVFLMYLSTEMLRVDPGVQRVAIALAVAVSVAGAGLATGLGAVFLNLEQRNPAAIVSGFGGTLNLVLSLGFMLATVIPFAGLFHLALLGSLKPSWLSIGLAIGMVWLIVLTLVAAAVPLLLGQRSLVRREY